MTDPAPVAVSSAQPFSLDQTLDIAGRGTVAWLLTLMLIVGLSEGVGILMLVPMLPLLEGGGQSVSFFGLGQNMTDLSARQAATILLAAFVLLITLRALAQYWLNRAALTVESRVVDGMRHRAVSALVHADWRTLSNMRQSENRALLITNVNLIGFAISQALTAIALLVTLAILGVTALALSPEYALVALLGGAAVLALYAGIRRRAQKLGEQLNEAHETIHERLERSLDAVRFIKSYGAERRAIEETAGGFASMRQVQFAYLRVTGWGRVALHAGGAVALAIMVWFALGGTAGSAAALVPLIVLFGRALMLVGGVQEAWQHYRHAAPALKDLRKLVSDAEANTEAAAPSHPPVRLTRAVSLDNVSIAYRDGQPVLREINLRIDAGTAVALTGSSGSGKSTLADILAGMIAPDGGQMLIDGTEIGGDARRAWRERVAYVEQDPAFFPGSIEDNLRWALPDATSEHIEQALRRAAAEFVFSLPEGLATQTGDSGHQLSGGERQRIALARALLRDPDLLILDEATSALDVATENSIAEAVAALKSRCTILIVGHNGVLTGIADETFHLEGGEVGKAGNTLRRG